MSIVPFGYQFDDTLFGDDHQRGRQLVTRPVRPQARATIPVGGRLSTDTAALRSWGALRTIIPPPDATSAWRFADLDTATLERISPTKLMELLADLSPEVSRALWDYLRLMNPGWEATATRPGAKSGYSTAQKALDSFIAQLADYYGSFDVVVARLDIAAALRGAYAAELVLDGRGRLPVDLATPDPAVLRFRWREDPVRGKVAQLCQQQGTQLIDLDRPTIRYIPIDPFPGSPYGRPLFSAALFSSLFLLAMLHDLRRVVQQQGYPRIDIAINVEELLKLMPEELEGDTLDANGETEQYRWLRAAITEISRFYAKLEPDDAYVHPKYVEVNRPVGAVDSSSLGAVGTLIEALERMSVRALKSMPVFMAMNITASEGMANRMWEIHVAGIKALQHLKETLLGRLFGLALQAQGIQADVEVRFAELRVAELLRDEQVRALQITNADRLYQQGVITQDQRAQLLGYAQAAEAKPVGATADTGALVGGQPDPGSER